MNSFFLRLKIILVLTWKIWSKMKLGCSVLPNKFGIFQQVRCKFSSVMSIKYCYYLNKKVITAVEVEVIIFF